MSENILQYPKIFNKRAKQVLAEVVSYSTNIRKYHVKSYNIEQESKAGQTEKDETLRSYIQISSHWPGSLGQKAYM